MHAPAAAPPAIGPDTLDWLTPLRWTRLWGTCARAGHTGPAGLDWAGVAWRSALGPPLLAVSPEAFADLYGDAHLPPSQAWSLSVQPGPGPARVDLALRLFGPLDRHRPALLQALRQLRLGPDRVSADWQLGGWQVESALSLLQPAGDTDRSFTLASLTPLALARPEGPGGAPPDTALVWRRLLSRLQQLHGPGRRALPTELRHWTDWVDRQPEQASAWQRVCGRRHSVRQARQMPLSGWHGQITWGPASAALQPWWRLAQAVQLGAKTRFGLGALRLSDAD